MTTAPPATAASHFTIGGDLPVRRLGYGTMQLTGPGHWDLPPDPDNAIAVLRTAVHELGITHLDTADAYGPHTVETLIRQALHPYPHELVIATKGGLARPGPNVWRPCGRPEYLHQCVELSLRRLGVDCLDLYYLHRIDPQVPLADQLGVLDELRQAGKIRHLGLSKVTVEQVHQARAITDIAAVQNQHRLATVDPVLPYCEQHGLAYVAYKPFNAGTDPTTSETDPAAATKVLQTLLQRSPAMLVIPGTASLSHLRANCAADQSTGAQTADEDGRS
ncbi:aldo/keto reductase [Paractinoplanes ferrugineus]|uniref:Oxidoreductase n=1 Tax=Paractinoplanes ferrugineus TaxID=113564 RepID=A0A919J9K7_9ACTN|nr:aldo/keto reductase [Actinoplanes ferrugineus]GIE15204.1 oxidoreductase [Actinoplanes ferrugineus]